MVRVRVGISEGLCTELFEEGRATAEQCGSSALLVSLYVNYALDRGLNQGSARDNVRYTLDAVRIADRTDDLALRAGSRALLAWAYLYCGRLTEAEQIADEAIALVGDDLHLGTSV